MASVFHGLHESLQQVLLQRLGWSELRDVQEQSYRAVIRGSDVLILAPTAGGKSEAALIPVMDDILRHGRTGVTCLYISPLKALINDQEERFLAFCLPTGLSLMKWHGDVPKGDRGWKDGEPPHFLMITPESLEVLLQEKDLARDLDHLRYVIIDELHAFVESERGVHLKILLDRIDRLTKRPVQRIGLSATVGNPREILSWMSDERHKSEIISVPSPAKQKKFLFVVDDDEDKRLDALVRIVAGQKALVFVNSRSVAERIVKAVSGRIKNLHIHHSSLSTALRKDAEEAFHGDGGACIICTSTLELGIDVGDLDVVVQMGPPDTVSSFLQRMGRSGRRGQPAFVAWILANPCELLCSCAVIECAMNKEVEPLLPPKKPYNVLVQQLFLTVFYASRISRKKLVRELFSHPVFSAVPESLVEATISSLIREKYLAPDGDMVMLGDEAERVFGRSNWKDLYSVISGGGEYRAVTPDGEVVGKLDARFVNSPGSAEFSLGGRSWSVVKCDEGHNLVVVTPQEGGKSRIFWSGGGEDGYSPLICRKMQQIIARRDTVLPLGDAEREILKEVFRRLPDGIDDRGLAVQERKGKRGKEVVVFSFNGSRFNRVLSLLLKRTCQSRIQARYNDYAVMVQRAGKEDAAGKVAAAIRDISALSWDDAGSTFPLPSCEGWKFAQVLTPAGFRDMVLSDYYHLDEFREAISGMAITVLPDATQDPPPDDSGTG